MPVAPKAAAAAAFCGAVPPRFAVAVSGGSDSLAALHLLAEAFPGQVLAVTVDHGLRATAAAEAADVGHICARLGIGHQTLIWQHGPLSGNLQDQARRARYQLMADWAIQQDIGDILIAHTADDQAETLLMGLARTAGIDGLSGLRPEWHQYGIHWHRPFLSTTRQALRDHLTALAQPWAEDPSNQNDQFQRIKARRALAALRPLGLTAASLAQTARNLAQAQQALNQTLADWLGAHATTPAGSVVFSASEFTRLPPELQRRMIAAALEWIGGAGHTPRAISTARLVDAVHQAKTATLAGCRLRHFGSGKVELHREYAAAALHCAAVDQAWDQRWTLTASPPFYGTELLQIRALGAEGLRLCPDWPATGHSRFALLASPSLWSGDRLVAAPLAGKANGWQANLAPSFARFILSH